MEQPLVMHAFLIWYANKVLNFMNKYCLQRVRPLINNKNTLPLPYRNLNRWIMANLRPACDTECNPVSKCQRSKQTNKYLFGLFKFRDHPHHVLRVCHMISFKLKAQTECHTSNKSFVKQIHFLKLR